MVSIFCWLFIGRGGSRGGCTRFLIGGSHQSGLLVGCLFFVLFLFSVFCGSVSCDDSFCVEYSLQNECTSVLGTVSIEQGEQEDFFNENVSLTISDVRMRPEKCRKPFLLYYCQLMFGGFVCQSSSREEQLCFEQETCRQVAEACSDEFSLDCLPSSFPTSTPTTSFRQSICNEICDVEVEEQIEQAKENIIRVETCLDGSKEQIECCNDPFIFDDNDECVIECPQYLVGQSLEKWVGLTDFVFNWLFLIALIAAIPPLYFMANIRYPNNVLLFAYGAYILAGMVYMSAVFDGVSKFICNGEKSYWDGLNHFAHLPRNLILYSIWVFFTSLSYIHWTLFAFNLFCHSVRPFTSSFDKFIDQPTHPLIIILMEGLCFGISGGLGLTCLFYGLQNKVIFFPSPISAFPASSNAFLSRIVLVVLLTILGGVAAFFMLLSIIFFMKRGRHIFYFQWRSIFVGCFWCVWTMWTLFIYYLGIHQTSPSRTEVFKYPNCVASHPRTNSPPCQREHPHFTMLVLTSIFTTSFFFILLFITFWTNSLVIRWWKELIRSKRILRSTNQKYEVVN